MLSSSGEAAIPCASSAEASPRESRILLFIALGSGLPWFVQLHFGEDAGAVAVLFHRYAGAVQHGQKQVGNWRVVRVLEVLSATHAAGATADDDRGQREMVVRVAVRHVRAVEDHAVLEQRVLAVGNR